jgi:hypothetical protein
MINDSRNKLKIYKDAQYLHENICIFVSSQKLLSFLVCMHSVLSCDFSCVAVH